MNTRRRNRRRFLLAQLNTTRRLMGQLEIVRFHGNDAKLAAAVRKAFS